jgi:integrase
MYLSKRNGVYYLYYHQNSGKITSKSTSTKLKSEALKFLSKFEVELIFQFLKHSESIHKWNHSKTLRVSLNQASKYFGDIKVDSFSVFNIQAYINYRFSKVSVYAVKRDIATLSNIFNFATVHNYMKANPVKHIKKPSLPEKQPLYFSKIEFNKFLLSIDKEDFKDLVLLAVNTGLRQMELLTLTKEQIDLNRGLITLDNRTHITKTNRIRVIPLNDRAKDVLGRHITKEIIFPFTQHQTVKLFRKYRAKSGIREELTFHSLRHTFASWLVQKGVPILNVSKLLGHSDIKTTQIYAHLSTNDLASSVMELD